MAKISLITGGAATGKSRWAVSYFQHDNVLYICTSKKLDKDIVQRIKYSNEHNFVEWIIAEDVKIPLKWLRNTSFIFLIVLHRILLML